MKLSMVFRRNKLLTHLQAANSLTNWCANDVYYNVQYYIIENISSISET